MTDLLTGRISPVKESANKKGKPMQDWLKTTGIFVAIMIIWDCIRIFVQAWVNKKFMAKDFKKLNEAIEEEE